jgi:hypothetical protein
MKKKTRCLRRVASRVSAAAAVLVSSRLACVGCRWPLLACVVLAVVEKRKTYQKLETQTHLEPLSLLLRAEVVVVTVGSLLLLEVMWLLFGGYWSLSLSLECLVSCLVSCLSVSS